jgi:hypothetical protein
MELIESCAWDYPSTKLLWYYCFTLRENELWHKTCVFFLHTVVAYLADFVLLCIRRKALLVSTNQYRYTTNSVDFQCRYKLRKNGQIVELDIIFRQAQLEISSRQCGPVVGQDVRGRQKSVQV